jgi:hypothetical protein
VNGISQTLGRSGEVLGVALTVLEHGCGVPGEGGNDPGFPGRLNTLGTLLFSCYT